MSFDIFAVCSAVVAAIVFLVPVKEFKGSYFTIAAALLSVIVVTRALKGAGALFSYLNVLSQGEMSFYFKILLKVLGITLICNTTSDLASDMGMSSLSGKVEFAGKIAVILSAMPMFDLLLGEIQRLI